jgi:hypothetical protein
MNRNFRRGVLAVSTVGLLLSGGAAFTGRTTTVRTSKATTVKASTAHARTSATKASRLVTTTDRCASLDAQLDSAIARGPQTGPAHDALLNAETISLRDAGCPAEAGTATMTTTTSASSIPAGTAIHDTAHLVGDDPTGHINFTVYTNGTCSGSGTAVPPPATVNGSGSYNSSSVSPNTAGNYAFRAFYSGDGENSAVTSACEPFTVTPVNSGPASPTLTTRTAASTISAGHSMGDTATLSGGANPTGQIGFTLFTVSMAGHDCTNSGTGTPFATVNVGSGNGNYTATTPVINTPGQYSIGAFYNGDANNNTATSACEPFTVTP